MKRVLVSLICAAPLLAFGADQNADKSFFKHAAEGGLAEVEAGNLAESKGTSQAVKDFGAMMVKDHSAANDKLKSIAAADNVSLPSKPSARQMAAKTKLEALSGESFDKAYIKNQIAAHVQTVALFKNEAASGANSQAKAFASETLPTLRAHLKKIREIATEQGVATK